MQQASDDIRKADGKKPRKRIKKKPTRSSIEKRLKEKKMRSTKLALWRRVF